MEMLILLACVIYGIKLGKVVCRSVRTLFPEWV
jgi:hypothetical protein